MPDPLVERVRRLRRLKRLLSTETATTTYEPDPAYGIGAPAQLGQPWTDPLSSQGPGSEPHQQYQFETPGAVEEFRQRRQAEYTLPVVEPVPPQPKFETKAKSPISIEEVRKARKQLREKAETPARKPTGAPIEKEWVGRYLEKALEQAERAGQTGTKVYESLSKSARRIKGIDDPNLKMRELRRFKALEKKLRKHVQPEEGGASIDEAMLRGVLEQVHPRLGIGAKAPKEIPIERETFLEGVGKALKGGVETAFDVYDIPGAYIRSGISGETFEQSQAKNLPSWIQRRLDEPDVPGRLQTKDVLKGFEAVAGAIPRGQIESEKEFAKVQEQLGQLKGPMVAGEWTSRLPERLAEIEKRGEQQARSRMHFGAAVGTDPFGAITSMRAPVQIAANQARAMAKAAKLSPQRAEEFAQRAGALAQEVGPGQAIEPFKALAGEFAIPRAIQDKVVGRHMERFLEPELRLGVLGAEIPGSGIVHRGLERLGIDRPIRRAIEGQRTKAAVRGRKAYASPAERASVAAINEEVLGHKKIVLEEMRANVISQLETTPTQVGMKQQLNEALVYKQFAQGAQTSEQFAKKLVAAMEDYSSHRAMHKAGELTEQLFSWRLPAKEYRKFGNTVRDILEPDATLINPEFFGKRANMARNVMNMFNAGVRAATNQMKRNLLLGNPKWFAGNAVGDGMLQYSIGHTDPNSYSWIASNIGGMADDAVIFTGVNGRPFTKGELMHGYKQYDLLGGVASDTAAGARADILVSPRDALADELLGAMGKGAPKRTGKRLASAALDITGNLGVSRVTGKLADSLEAMNNQAVVANLLKDGHSWDSAIARLRMVKPNYAANTPALRAVRTVMPFIKWGTTIIRNSARIVAESPYMLGTGEHLARAAFQSDFGEARDLPPTYRESPIPIGQGLSDDIKRSMGIDPGVSLGATHKFSPVEDAFRSYTPSVQPLAQTALSAIGKVPYGKELEPLGGLVPAGAGPPAIAADPGEVAATQVAGGLMSQPAKYAANKILEEYFGGYPTTFSFRDPLDPAGPTKQALTEQNLQPLPWSMFPITPTARDVEAFGDPDIKQTEETMQWLRRLMKMR